MATEEESPVPGTTSDEVANGIQEETKEKTKVFCTRHCKVFLSENREEYHKLRLEGNKTYEDLSQIAKSKGEDISHMSFFRHFTKHVVPQTTFFSSQEEKWVEKKKKERLDLLTEIETNLQTLRTMTENVMKLPIKSSNINAYTRLCSEIRLTLKYVSEHRQLFLGGGKLSEEASVQKFIDALSEIPEEYRTRVIATLKEGE